MITDRELGEYRSLCASLASSNEKFLKRREEFRLLLEETIARRREALLVLVKANRITRHLTGYQRQSAGLTYFLGEIKARINQTTPVHFPPISLEGEALPDFWPVRMNSRELRQRGLALINLIDGVKKKILQLDLLELRCRELLLSINKALKAFCRESKLIRRKIYPFGIFSQIYRSLGNFFGKTYFSFRDMKELSALGNVTGFVLKIADSPLV